MSIYVFSSQFFSLNLMDTKENLVDLDSKRRKSRWIIKGQFYSWHAYDLLSYCFLFDWIEHEEIRRER